METKEILVSDVIITDNHRSNIGETALDEMMQSLKQNGLQQPIGVAPVAGGKFRIIFGHRRFVAAQKLGWKKIAAIVKRDVSSKRFTVLQLTENMQRKDPSFAEFGRAIEKLLIEKMTFKEMAVVLGKTEKEIRKIFDTYKALPARHRAKVKFMAKGKGDRGGGIPHSMATQIAQIKKHQGLSNDVCDKLFDYVQKNDCNKEFLNTLAVMLNQGLDLDTAVAKMENYRVYHIEVVAAKNFVLKLIQDHKCKGTGLLFKKIIYGIIPGVPKPDFIKLKDEE